MIITIDGVGDLEVAPDTPLSEILAAGAAPAARWCGPVSLDAAHRAGLPPLVHGARLTDAPRFAPARTDRPHLHVIAGPDAGASLAPTAPATIGRAAAAALSVQDTHISKAHAEIDVRGRVRDRGSTNGTARVRHGRRTRIGARRRRLRDGDVIAVGGSLLAWRDPAASNAAERQAAHTRPATASPRATLAGGGGAIAGAVAVGIVTGRWWVGAILAAVPIATAAILWLRRGATGSGREADGVEALADLPLPVAVIGDHDAARGVARAIAVVAARAWSGTCAEPWDEWLPDRADEGALALTPPGSAAPTEARTVLDLGAGVIRIDGRERAWTPAVVSAATAEALARSHAATAPPALGAVRWGELDAITPPLAGGPRRLVAAIGRDLAGTTVSLDLDVDGPHLLVAGTTGSGKSLLLETLVAALAHRHGPQDLAIALVDFKGGAGLGPCAALPHGCGLLTDLEPTIARRAWLGLAHELGARKRALKALGLPSWSRWEATGDAPPRLLVVIDEFQELAAADPQFLSQVATLAAQGRSLGMHLLLATQRPAGVVTPQIRANVGTVIALRVATAAESHDLLGDDAAARLPAGSPGRAVIATPTARTTVQVALPAVDPRPRARLLRDGGAPRLPLAAEAARRWTGRPPPARLWLPPLADGLAAAPGTAGWTDHPETRSRTHLTWDHATGTAVVLGPRGSARDACARGVAATVPGFVTLPEDPRQAVRTLELASAGLAPAVLIEDAERASAALAAVLRVPGDLALEDYARRVPLVLACAPGWPARWASRSAIRLVLPGIDRAEQTLWGVPPDLRILPGAPGRAVAVSPAGAAECLVDTAPSIRAAPPLARPLRCPAGLAAEFVGVRGDSARPLALVGEVAVVGPAGAERDAAAAVLRASGATVITMEVPPRPAPRVAVVTAPEMATLRSWGLRPEPGTVDPAPPPGRVVVVNDGTCEAAQLRPLDGSGPGRHHIA